MWIALQTLVFCLINWYGIRYISAKSSFTLTSSLDKERTFTFSGAEMFVIMTGGCAIIAAPLLGQLAMRLFFWEVLLIYGIWKSENYKFYIAIRFYFFFILWCLFSLFVFSKSYGYGFRQLAKYMLPLLLLAFVPSAVKCKDVFYKLIQMLYVVFSVWCGCFIAQFCGLGVFVNPITCLWWWEPAILDSYGVLLSVVMITYQIKKAKYLLWVLVVALMVPLSGYVVRTGFVALGSTLAVMSVFKFRKNALIPLIILIVSSLIFVFTVPQMREKMFRQNVDVDYLMEHPDEFKWDYIDDNGRSAMWERILDDLYVEHKWTGSGIGSQQSYMYAKAAADGTAGIVHNDWVILLCDVGLIGLILYLLAVFAMIRDCYRMYQDQENIQECRQSAFIAGASLFGCLAAMTFDNVVNYSMCTLALPYTFYGIAIALVGKKNVITK